ncbi:transposase, partial [Streptomyces sioyaensis]|uniref:transposase n=1 Tax=Streptomyces sioyaensis TaxID=67364 RepID=UPI0034090E58
MILVWDGLSAHWSRVMRAWVADQDWLTLERLPAYAPELNPVELLWSSLKKRELANLAGDHLADVAEQGVHRINHNQHLPWSYLPHTGLTIHLPHPPDLRITVMPLPLRVLAVARRRGRAGRAGPGGCRCGGADRR